MWMREMWAKNPAQCHAFRTLPNAASTDQQDVNSYGRTELGGGPKQNHERRCQSGHATRRRTIEMGLTQLGKKE